MKRVTLAGLVLSVIWIIAFACLLYFKRDTLAAMKVNEWGDFFAGVVAPLAFLWLVLGYIQQGEDLRLNNEALKVQQEELRLQVAETAKLASASERQAISAEQLALASRSEAERISLREIAEAQPLLRPSGGSGSGTTFTLNVVNAGATVFELDASCESVTAISFNPKLQLEAGQTATLRLEGVTSYPFNFLVTYHDRLGTVRTQKYQMVEPFNFVPARETHSDA